MKHWINFKLKHLDYYIKVDNIIDIMYNDGTKSVYVTMINNKVIEIPDCEDLDLQRLIRDISQ